jgi:ABC-type sulfate transport system permease subunit
MVKVKIFIKGELKSAWRTSIFLAVGAVFSQVVNCLPVNIVIFKAFKDSIQLFS